MAEAGAPPVVNALMTGLVRDEAALRAKMAILLAWRDEGLLARIVFSTWLGELGRYPGLAEYLAGQGIVVVETQEPNLYIAGSIMQQMKSLHFGLMCLDPGSFVFKLRADKTEIPAGMRDFIARFRAGGLDLRIAPPAGWPDFGLRYRICTHNVLLQMPFFFNDMLYFGCREDLLRLISFDLAPDFFFPCLNAEQRLFMTPFLPAMPVFFQYFRVNPGLIHESVTQAQAATACMIQSGFCVRVLLSFFIVMTHYFLVGFDLPARALPNPAGMTWQDLFLPRDNFVHPALQYATGANAMNLWTDALIAGVLAAIAGGGESPLREAYQDAASWAWQSGFDHATLGHPPGAAALISAYKAATGRDLVYPAPPVTPLRIQVPWWDVNVMLR